MSNDLIQIVLIEDNRGDVYLFRKAFETAGLNFELTVLDDGARAIAYIRGEEPYANSAVPDLIVLDLNLPKHDGAQILRVLAHTERFARVPVVVASSEPSLSRVGDEGSRVAKCVRKPSELDEFLNIGLILKQVLLESKHGSAPHF